MKLISEKELKNIIIDHVLWATSHIGGKQAILRNIDFQKYNLSGFNLLCINISNSDLSKTNLMGSTLEGSILKNNIMPDISWIKPGTLVKLHYIQEPGFTSLETNDWVNFYDCYVPIDELYRYGTILQLNNSSFNMLVHDKIIYGIPKWVLYTGLLKP